MKLIYLLSIILSSASFAQGDLSTALRSQNNGPRLNVGNLQVPNNQATKTGAINALIETGNLNLLSNPSFEHQKNWAELK